MLEFWAKSTSKRKTCSTKCSLEYQTEYRKKWQKSQEFKDKMKLPENKEKYQKYQKEYMDKPGVKERKRQKGKEYRHSLKMKEKYRAKKRIINCVMCDVEFETNHGTKKTCSSVCAKKHNQQCVRKRQQDPRVIAEAKVKRDMSENRMEKKPLKIKNCIVCDVEFETNHGTKINCSPKCSEKHNLEYIQSPEYKASRKEYYQNIVRKEAQKILVK